MSGERPTWQAYNEAQLTRPVRPLAKRLLEHAGPGNGRAALDLGCGSGVETRALVTAGWRVTAVDSDPSMPDRLQDLVAGGDVTAVVGDLRDVAPGRVALVHSSLSLPFVPSTDFAFVWERVRRCLLPGGWLGVDLFGPRDDWHGTPGLSFHPRSGVDQLMAGLEVVDLVEEERDAPSFGGVVKHWHTFHVIARRPGEAEGAP
ncbi:class I SAM-dependent methyltransferase [Nocardioides sp. zg-1308]|uniref:class I SAM-dependent methyltransferase n=1 Tax=Nocardioides sp. zg-1308 TaxID=2736253 RepID=UPI0015560F70|nr:class I SAM-dependent methyltransferase [Nocardioides sp. zg-1308]